ncbi:hypothetical protein L596_019027 [Steinernema carpocapsae]|uniref:Uncharacterized protein n=1 Tax=Steinernema carpocapsae TaxID=34508 RepID=A0A4V6A293_STECR|nr:hypothetical protein L596_019027 [Steinernema carpocapsae]
MAGSASLPPCRRGFSGREEAAFAAFPPLQSHYCSAHKTNAPEKHNNEARGKVEQSGHCGLAGVEDLKEGGFRRGRESICEQRKEDYANRSRRRRLRGRLQ